MNISIFPLPVSFSLSLCVFLFTCLTICIYTKHYVGRMVQETPYLVGTVNQLENFSKPNLDIPATLANRSASGRYSIIIRGSRN